MMNGRERPRPPVDIPSHREPRRGGDGRNGDFAGAGGAPMSRADKFEDEKRRIMHSCFSKRDNDGVAIESYITHIRVTEDAAYPSTPPPPNSPPDNKKRRVIIVAVRRSGRVRMHKARENIDGSFSVGKTWMLDDLSAIQSFNGWVPQTPAEQQQKQWASNAGFVVTVGKSYYWHAGSSKEKEFFIGSLLKIYRKYTGGKVPNLIGFDDRERQLLAGQGPPPPGPRGPVQNVPPSEGALPGPRPPASHGPRPQSPFANRAPSRDGHRELRRRPSEEPSLRVQRSRDQMQRPSTSQSAKSIPPPLAPPQHTPPAPPLDKRGPPPPRANERLVGDSRMPKPTLMPLEMKNFSPPTSSGPVQRPKPYGDLDNASQASLRSFSSRDGKSMPESRPVLRGQDLAPTSPVIKRSKDGLRPGTSGSNSVENVTIAQSPVESLGQKSLNESVDRLSAADARRRSRDNDMLNDPSNVNPVGLPPSLRPGSSKSSIHPIPSPVSETVEAARPSTPQETKPSESAAETSTVSPPASSPPAPPPEPVEEEKESHRPGLGPMVKKKSSKDIAGAFRKAATAYGAFKPRPGGAGERLLAAAIKEKCSPEEPDGITGVVPAPSLRAINEPRSPLPETPANETPFYFPSPVKETPTVEVTQAPTEDGPAAAAAPVEGNQETRVSLKDLPDNGSVRSRSVSPSPNGLRRRRREDNTAKYCQSLGIDPSILDGHGLEFDDILTDLGWNGRLSDDKRIEDLEADIRREIGRVEATSWLGNLEQQEGKVDQLAKLIDKTIEECEELDGLLTLYSHELNTLNDDVAYIEAQSQGLQVQTANQKLLHNELQNLLKTLSISPSYLRPLKEASLSNPAGLQETETVLSTLYKAMLMIDSDIWQNKKRLVDAAGEHSSVGVYADTEIGQMRAIKEKKEEYRSEARFFLQRLKQFMVVAFKMAEQKMLEAAANGHKDPMKLDSAARDWFRQELWMYNPLMLFAREVSVVEWHGLISLYEQQAKRPYQSDFRENNLAWKRAARQATGDEHEVLFTHPEKEKENESITIAARKLTVRRGKTIKGPGLLRLASSETQNGKLEPFEAFAGTLEETLHTISDEQNFVVQFFHLDSVINADFPDLVAAAAPEDRTHPDFTAKQPHDPDRAMAKKVEHVMDELYSFWPTDMDKLVDWAMKTDPLQVVGIMFSLEKAISDFEETNQEFIIHSLQKLHTRLVGTFNRFIDEQIRGIEETKVKVNKRKGVISFMRVFPHFSAAVESMMSHPSQDFYDVRISVNEAYNRINRAMWESLKFIAKEAPGQPPGATASGGDPEDKEILNYHILIIENMNHYLEEVEVKGNVVLEKWRDRAHQDLREHMELYLDAVIHRPLGKLLDFVESAESLLGSAGNPSDLSSRASHSRSVAKKVLSSYDAKEVRQGAHLLKKRVEKHFGDADDPALSRGLVLNVLQECEARYEDAYNRTRRLIDTVYEGQLELEWRLEDAISMLRK